GKIKRLPTQERPAVLGETPRTAEVTLKLGKKGSLTFFAEKGEGCSNSPLPHHFQKKMVRDGNCAEQAFFP
ncbi:MAG: hypothetical protein D6767_02755, partial [Candidatus Hydrogenedentota bacterium]